MGLIFHYSTSLHPDACPLAYHSTYIACIRDLPLSSIVSHSFLLAAQGVKAGIHAQMNMLTLASSFSLMQYALVHQS